MKLTLIVLFFVGIIISILGYYRNKDFDDRKVEYRFISKGIEELYATQKSTYQIFKPMFESLPILA